MTRDDNVDRRKFMEMINHPCPSVSTLQEWFPMVNNENRQFHEKFLQLHIRILSKSDASISLKFQNVIRHPVVMGIDEQELNQGTFIQDGVLYGLSKALDVSSLQKIVLKELPSYILNKCPFISSVREYRLTDIIGAHCSNIFTAYLSGVLKTDECEKTLKEIIELSNRCQHCLKNKIVCSYKSIDKPCQACSDKNIECTSLIVFHVLWDMDSSHKATAKRMNKITIESTDEDFRNPKLQSVGFGGLHLSKSPTNSLRNHVLTCGGQNYGVNVIRALKNSSGDHSNVLANLKTAVIVGKDRQSDYYSYETTSNTVQQSLKLAKVYKCVRIPEPLLYYCQNAKKQKKIVLPTGIQCNQNGDVFILDSGASCVHAVERSSVAQVFILGQHSKASSDSYNVKNMITASKVKLSNYLNDIFIPPDKDDIFVVDSGRNEVVIVRNCSLARKIISSNVNILKKVGIRSLCMLHDKFVCLIKTESAENWVEVFEVDLPAVRQASPLEITGNNLKKINLSQQIRFIFSLPAGIFGMVSDDKELLFHSKLGSCNDVVERTGIKTMVKPQVQGNSNVVYLPPLSEQLNHLIVSAGKKASLSIKQSNKVVNGVSSASHCVAAWGSTYHLVSNINGTNKLIEYGDLSFGLKFSECLNSFYKAINYIPPHGFKSGEKKTLLECIELAEKFVTILSSMQEECKSRFPTLNSFRGVHGMVFTDTVGCIISTVESWKAVCERLHYFDSSLVDKVNPHTVTNEALIEHAFGFTKLKGQSQLQSMMEYLHNKMKSEIDFQLRLCKTNFCQYVKVKLRDKAYQHLDEQFMSLLEMEDIWEILFSERTKKVPSNTLEASGEKLLKQAYLLTKSVPRQSNRAKWKENSGYAPNMLAEQDDDDGKLLKNDVIFCRDPFGGLKKLIVLETTMLKNISENVAVKDVQTASKVTIPVSALLKDKGLLFVVPSTLYEVIDDDVLLNDVASQMLQDCLDFSEAVYTDEEISQLPCDVDEGLGSSGNNPASASTLGLDSSDEEECVGPSKRKKMRPAVSDDDSENEIIHEVEGQEPCQCNRGDWVIAKFVFKSKVNNYLGQVVKMVDNEPNKRRFQFYRMVLPNQHEFVKTINEEIHDVSVVIEQVHKSHIDIISGDKIKLVGFEPTVKLV